MPSYSFMYDPREFYRTHLAVQRIVGRRWRLAYAAFAALLLILYVVPPLLYGTFDWSLANFVPLVVLALIVVFARPVAAWYTARTLPRREPSLQGPQGRVLTENGLEVRGHGVVLTLEWAAILRVIETPEVFLLFFNRKYAHYLPKRAIPDGEVEQVRQLFREKLGERFEEG